MIFKKTFTVILVLCIILSLVACQKDSTTESFTENSTNAVIEESTEKTEKYFKMSEAVSTLNTTETTVPVSTEVSAVAPSLLTKAEIINAYIKAAENSNKSVKSEQAITFSNISINNGQFEGVIDFVMPIMSKLISNNAKEKDGITGGYANLSESDVYEAKAYPVGNNIAIEMVMHEQTDGAHGDMLGGTVGHAISVVGDIGDVVKQLNDLGLPIEISDEQTSIHYTNPVVKVLIDEDGKIIKGTWTYTVDIRLNNYKVGGKTVDTTSVVMDNVITVNGGF